MKLTRRHLASAVLAPAAAATALVQTQPSAASEDLLQAARDRIKANTELLAKQEIPMATEPAFQFKA
jgi:hypothetical protein